MEKGRRPLRSTRRVENRIGFQPTWYKITNSAADGAPTQVSIYDEIGFYGVPAGQFLDDMKAIKGDVELHLNSPGGDVFEGIAIYNTLLQRQGNVKVVVDGLAASAASFIAMAASKGQLEIAPHAQMMIHDGFAMGIGNASDMRALADQLDTVSDEIAGIYADRTGKPVDYWRQKMQAETWYTDKQAVQDGLADRIHGQADEDPAEQWDLSVFAKYAEENGHTVIKNAAPATESGDDEPDDSNKCPTCKGSGKIMDGNRKCPDCNGTGQKQPEGSDTAAPGGKPSPAGNQLPVFPVLNADVDNSAWDAGKAWSAGAAADDPAAFYKGICAGRKAGDPSTQAAWALPYKYSPSGAPNAAGVRNALARLPQTQGLTNEAQARATLESAMKQVNPDYDPDDSIDTELLAELFSIGLEGSR